MLRRRLVEIVRGVQTLPEVDPKRVAAIGFCFGGLCVLDLARSGLEIRAVASFHGLFWQGGRVADGSHQSESDRLPWLGRPDGAALRCGCPQQGTDRGRSRLADPRVRPYDARFHGRGRQPARGRYPVQRALGPASMGVARGVPGRSVRRLNGQRTSLIMPEAPETKASRSASRRTNRPLR